MSSDTETQEAQPEEETPQEDQHEMFGGVDVAIQQDSLKVLFADYIKSGRFIAPCLVGFRRGEPALRIMARNSDGPEDGLKSILEVLSVIPASVIGTTMLVVPSRFEYETGEFDSLVMLAMAHHGFAAEAFPFFVNEETNEVEWPEGLLLSGSVDSIISPDLYVFLPTITGTSGFPGTLSEVLRWLSYKGHFVEYYGDINRHNIDALMSR